MTPAEVLDIGNEAIITLLKAGAPILGVALVVGRRGGSRISRYVTVVSRSACAGVLRAISASPRF